MEIQIVRLDEIAMEGEDFYRYSFSWRPVVDGLARSIRAVGLLHPVALIRREGRPHQVLFGCRRLLASRAAGLTSVPARLIPGENLDEPARLWMSLHEDAHARAWSDEERAVALDKFQQRLGLSPRRLSSDVAPFLGIPPSERVVENYLAAARLGEEALEAVRKGTITVGHAALIAGAAPEERFALLRLLARLCRANLNESRVLVALIRDLKEILGLDLEGLLARPPIREALESEGTSPRERLGRLRRELEAMRYPELTKRRSDFRRAAGSLGSDPALRINADRYFEEDSLSIRMEVRSRDELALALGRLGQGLKDGTIDELLRLVRS